MNLWQYALVGVLALFGVTDAVAQVRVKGYTRKDGTYVAPHYRSAPNSSRYDNYSTKGNYNPYTGKKGSVDPYGQTYAPSPYSPPASGYFRPAPSISSYAPTPAPARTGTTFWISPTPVPSTLPTDYTPEQGIEAVRALTQRLQVSDPYWDIRYPQLSIQLASIGKAFPPSLWAEETERVYWNIPASKSSRRPATSALLAQYSSSNSYECDATEDARQELEAAATSLAHCARQHDYSDDCSSEAREAKDAADMYEDAVSASTGQCY